MLGEFLIIKVRRDAVASAQFGDGACRYRPSDH